MGNLWHSGGTLKDRFSRVYALESYKAMSIRTKLIHPSLSFSFRRFPRGGAEQTQYDAFSELMQQVELTSTPDRWTWSLNPSGEFSVASVRKFIDDKLHPGGEFKTNWCRYVPIKVNIHAWKIMSNALATKFNISSRGIEIESLICVNSDVGVETTSHLFFTCITAQ
nr:RNA-directed DNA polymerase, eukaryota [Tanacetum cinerariifolium]